MKSMVAGIAAALLALAAASPGSAAEPPGLGLFHLGVKIDYLEFTDNVVEGLDVESGPYYAVEAFGRILPDLFLGAEVGYFNQEEEFGQANIPGLALGLELTYIPVELNLKYALDAGPWSWDAGAGLSCNYMDVEGSALLMDREEDDWLWGGQVFADLNYVLGSFFAGVNGKYQVVEKDLDNWRLGGQVGLLY